MASIYYAFSAPIRQSGMGWVLAFSIALAPCLSKGCPASLAAAGADFVAAGDDPDTIVLKRYRGEFTPPAHFTPEWSAANREAIRTGLAVDVETTGLKTGRDQIWEIGLRLFEFDRYTGEVLQVLEDYAGQQKPTVPFSAKALQVIGGKEPALEGKTIDWVGVQRLFRSAHVVFAHNASFDRAFLELLVPEAIEKVWACTMMQVDWAAKRYSSSKLELLSMHHGFFVNAHEALSDVWALFRIATHIDPTTRLPYLSEVLINARKKPAYVAVRFPYGRRDLSNDLLKDRDYRWNPEAKSWIKFVDEQALVSEKIWLEGTFFNGNVPEGGIETKVLKVNERFRDLAQLLDPVG